MRYLIAILLVLTVGISQSFAATKNGKEIDLQKEHGNNLDKAHFSIRYKFERDMKTEWKKSSWEQRKYFLEKWYEDLANDALQAKVKAKEERIALKQKEQEKVAKLKEAQSRKKEELAQEKEKLRLEKQEKKDFKRKVKERERQLKELRRSDGRG